MELHPGCRVEVRTHFLSTWTRGFEVAIRTPNGYIVRRNTDQALLPEVFHDDEVRRRTKTPWG